MQICGLFERHINLLSCLFFDLKRADWDHRTSIATVMGKKMGRHLDIPNLGISWRSYLKSTERCAKLTILSLPFPEVIYVIFFAEPNLFLVWGVPNWTQLDAQLPMSMIFSWIFFSYIISLRLVYQYHFHRYLDIYRYFSYISTKWGISKSFFIDIS